MRENALNKIALGVLLLAVVGCGRNRFDYIDIAASEKSLAALEEGFEAVPDSVSDGRTAFLLDQGLPVADVLVFRGETGDCLFPDPVVPFGYSCETIGTEVLLDSLHLKAGRLYTDSGLNGRILYLLDGRMSLKVLNKIAELAAGGAFIGGVKPSQCLPIDDDAAFQRTGRRREAGREVQGGQPVLPAPPPAGRRDLPDLQPRNLFRPGEGPLPRPGPSALPVEPGHRCHHSGLLQAQKAFYDGEVRHRSR